MGSSAIAPAIGNTQPAYFPLVMVKFRLETFQWMQHVLVETSVSVLGIANVAGAVATAVVYKTDTQLRARTRVNVVYQRRHDYQKV